MKLSDLKSIAPKEGEEPTITNKHRQDWNAYVKYLETKGMRGNVELDKGTNFDKALLAYKKENPSTTITKEMIAPIQKEFGKYREFALQQVRDKKAFLQEGVTEEMFLKDLSVVDGMAGSKTSSYEFPKQYIDSFVNDKKVSSTSEFATTENSFAKNK